MAFVALEDGFPQNPKVSALSDAEFRVWIRLLCWAAKYRTRGRVPAHIGNELTGVTRRRLEAFARVGLLDLDGSDFVIHDWDEFNGTSRERSLARERKRAQRRRDSGTDVTLMSRESHDADRDIAVTGHAEGVTPMSRSRARVQPQTHKNPKAVALPMGQADGLGFQIPADLTRDMEGG